MLVSCVLLRPDLLVITLIPESTIIQSVMASGSLSLLMYHSVINCKSYLYVSSVSSIHSPSSCSLPTSISILLIWTLSFLFPKWSCDITLVHQTTDILLYHQNTWQKYKYRKLKTIHLQKLLINCSTNNWTTFFLFVIYLLFLKLVKATPWDIFQTK